MYSSSAGSYENASPANVSITIFIHNICIIVIGDNIPIKGPIILNNTAQILTLNWNIINFLILLNIVLPYKIATDIESILLSIITISLVSFAISVALPIENPTSDFFNAGASFMPSPVIPTIKFNSWASLTKRFLSCGRLLLRTLKSGSIFLTSSSDRLLNSSLVNNLLVLLSIIFNSFAIATAVFLASPVTITTWIPAFLIFFIPSYASFLILSFRNIKPSKI